MNFRADDMTATELLLSDLVLLEMNPNKDKPGKDLSYNDSKLRKRLSGLVISRDALEIELIKEELDILGNSSRDEITCFRFGKVRAIKSARQLRDKYFRSIRDRIRGYEEFIDNIELDKEKDDIRYFGFFYVINFVYVR